MLFRRNPKRFLPFLALGLLCSSVGCQGDSPSATTTTPSSTQTQEESPEASPLEDVTLVLDWSPNTNHTGFYVGQALGYYEEEGLSLTIVQPPEDGASLLVATNQAQFGISMQDSLADALFCPTPLPITTIATLVQHNTSGLLSLASSDIQRPLDLEGKRYATWDLPVETAMMEAIVTEDGGDFQQVERIPSTVTDVLTALQTNIDVVWVFYGWDGIAAEVQGLDTHYLDFASHHPALDFYTPTIISSLPYLEESPEQARAFLRATAKGYEYAIAHPEEAATILLSAAPELDEALVQSSQDYLSQAYKAEVERWGYIDLERWDSFYFWLEEEELISAEVVSGMGFTNDYLP